MKLIVDTNIVFSTLLNPHSVVGEILMNIQDELTFFAPELLKEELARYHVKIAAYSRLDEKDLANMEHLVLSKITFISEASISKSSWIHAFGLTKDIDEDDTPFIALAIELDTKLWTGDKVLSKGLLKKGANIVMLTSDLAKLTK